MVGTTTKKRLGLASLTADLVGKPYQLGGWGNPGYDCLSLIYTTLERGGIVLPTSFSGYTKDDYMKLWEENPRRAKAIYIRFLSSISIKIKPLFSRAKDILIVKDYEGDSVIGLNAGNGLFLSCFTDVGVDLARLENYKVMRVYRWENRKN
jgi:hypothetical protein